MSDGDDELVQFMAEKAVAHDDVIECATNLLLSLHCRNSDDLAQQMSDLWNALGTFQHSVIVYSTDAAWAVARFRERGHPACIDKMHDGISTKIVVVGMSHQAIIETLAQLEIAIIGVI